VPRRTVFGVALHWLFDAQPAMAFGAPATVAPPQQFTFPPLNGTIGSAVPAKPTIATECFVQFGMLMTTATGPNAANVSGARQASTDDIAPPSDMPVA